MTREEAIHEIQMSYDIAEDAKDMAIEALSADATQTDLVQRSDVLEVISDAQDGSGSTYNILQPIFVKVNNLPSCHRCDECDDAEIADLKHQLDYSMPISEHEDIVATYADSVKVVRCKDCKHWQKTNIETIDGHPFYDCPFCGEWADANGFCSFGELAEQTDKGGDAEMQTIAKTPDYMQQIPSEDGSDLISRAELLKTVQHPCNQDGEWSTEEIVAIIDIMPSAVCDDCIWHVCNYNKVDWDAPSADAVQGEWIMHVDDLFPCESTQECSVCHEHQPMNINDDNFCPNCGAKMRGGEDE